MSEFWDSLLKRKKVWKVKAQREGQRVDCGEELERVRGDENEGRQPNLEIFILTSAFLPVNH